MVVSTETWMSAQQSVLGACLIDDRAVSRIVFGLSEDDFCQQYRSLYTAMRDLYTTGKPVDPVTVLAVVGPEYKKLITDLMVITPSAANAGEYVEILRTQTRVLQLRDVGNRLTEINSEEEGRELISAAAAPSAKSEAAVWSMSQGLSDFFNRYSRKPEYLDWFLPDLRRVIRAEKTDYCILGGRPSDGKSAFALQAALYWSVVCGKRVGFFSHETSREKLMDRLIATGTGVSFEAVKERKLSEKDMTALCSITAKIADAPLFLIQAAGKTVAEMQEIALHKHFDIVIVDYLQIVSAAGESEYAQVTSISKGLHMMCQRYGIFCLALCQLSRTRGERPKLDDLRSSGQIEQDADCVFFLHRLNEPGEPREFIIAKNKDGERNITRLHFNGGTQQFQYLGRGNTPVKPYDYGKTKQENMEPTVLDGQTAIPFE